MAALKPTHKAIQHYYATLREYREHQVAHEGALSTAFQTLLADTCKAYHLRLVPQESIKVGGKRIRPDGILFDLFNLRRGYWEAKDEEDDLNVEIAKKRDRGYPLVNTIFEDTQQAVLFQGKREIFRADLAEPNQLAQLLNQFYQYVEPDHESFEQAVAEFQEQVPDLAKGLAANLR